MHLTEITYDAAAPVDGYGPGFFRIDGRVEEGKRLLLPGRTVAWAGYDDSAALVTAADQIDVLFVGTGPEITALPVDFRDAMDAAGIGVEPMATPTACRTYNVLLSEGRRIAAALIPI